MPPCLFLLDDYDGPSPINLDVGEHLTIDISGAVAEVVSFAGDTASDPTQPDRPPPELLDVTLMQQPVWKTSVRLTDGWTTIYQWFLDDQGDFRV